MAEYEELRGALQRLGLEPTDIDDIVHLVGERREAQALRNDPEVVAHEAILREQLTKLLKNEEEFVSNLNIVTKTYLFPIQSGVVKMKTGTMLAIFSNFEMLAGLHKDLLGQLRAASSNFPNVSISTLFGEFVPSMQVYTQYVNKFSASLAALEAERSKSKAFSQFLLSCEESHPLPLEALLSLPLNRIPHYRGVLSQVQANTPRNGPEYIKLANVTRELSELQEYLNASKTQSDNMATVFKIESRIVGREYPLNDLHRTFIKEGDMAVLGEEAERDKKLKDSHVFLFNDILVVTKKLPGNQFRYRASHALQYNTLTVREAELTLHLTHPTSRETLSLGFSSDDALISWAGTLQRTLAAMERTTVFQTTLEEIMAREPEGALIPSVLAQLISTLERTALDVPGLFRVSGSSRTINSVISQLDRGIPVDLDKVDSHVLSGTLKQWLRTLKEPLIPFAFFDQLMACHQAAQPVDALRQLMGQLPTANVFVLKRLMQMCLRVAEHADLNKMTPTNLAIVIGPNLCREEVSSPFGEISISSSVGPLVELMLRHFHDIFPADPPTKFSKATPKSAVVTHTPQATAKGGLMGASRRAPRPTSPPQPSVSLPSSMVMAANANAHAAGTAATTSASATATAGPAAPHPSSPSPSPSPSPGAPVFPSSPPPSSPPPSPSPSDGPAAHPPPSAPTNPAPAPPHHTQNRLPAPPHHTQNRLPELTPPPPAQTLPLRPSPPKRGLPAGRAKPTVRAPRPVPPMKPPTRGRPSMAPGGVPRPLQPPPPAPRDRSPSQPPPPSPLPPTEAPVPAQRPVSTMDTVVTPESLAPSAPAPSPSPPSPASPTRETEPPSGAEDRAGAPEASGVCSRCQQPVDNEFIELGPRVWHPECFLCTICSSDLSSGYFRSEGKPICKACRRNRRTMPPISPAQRIN